MKATPAAGEVRPLRHISVKCFNLCGNGAGPRSKQELFIEDTFKITFCLCGNLKFYIFRNGEKSESFLPAGQCCFHYCPRDCRCVECACGECTKNLQLVFPCQPLRALLGEGWLPPEFRNKNSCVHHMVREITPAMNRIVDRIKDTCLHGDGYDLFFLVKALELFWLFSRSKRESTAIQVKLCDREAIRKARFILENNLEEPPALKDLAPRVGMSLSKFKQLFPKACGVPPYAYLRKVRMEKARHLLITGAMNVTDAAMAVGYSSPSHFAKAFVRQFGVRPSNVQKSAGWMEKTDEWDG